MFQKIPVVIAKIIGISFLVWILLSTALPQSLLKYSDPQIQKARFVEPTYPYNSFTSPSPLPIQDSTVYFIISHPDDEVMFFAPAMVEIAKPKHNNRVRLVCFSRGEAVDVSMGAIRSQELRHSARIFGLDPRDVLVLDNYADGMDVLWSAEDVSASLNKIIDFSSLSSPVLITFDSKGVSSHPNHISLFYGCKHFFASVVGPLNSSTTKQARLYALKSLSFWEKYSFTLLTNIELLVDFVSKFILSSFLKININISFFDTFAAKQRPSIKVYSDLNMLSLSYAAMAYGHFSQMVWFRYGWLILSRYLTFNHLIQIF